MESPDFPHNIIICTGRTCPDPRLTIGLYLGTISARLVYTDTDTDITLMPIASNDGGQRLNAKLEDNVHMSRVSSRFSGLTVDINL